jgi:hypothetical protein
MDEPKRTEEEKEKERERDEQKVADMDVPEKDAEEAKGGWGPRRMTDTSGIER